VIRQADVIYGEIESVTRKKLIKGAGQRC